MVVGKGNYVFFDEEVRATASEWKKEIEYDATLWGIEVPAQRKTLASPTFGELNLLFFQKSSTRAYYLMDFSCQSLRSVQMWRCWLAHNLIEQMKENLEISFGNRLNATERGWSLHWLVNKNYGLFMARFFSKSTWVSSSFSHANYAPIKA